MTTVYFDTSFYVWLSNAPEGQVGDVIRDLNELHIRHVLSRIVLAELATYRGAQANRERLHERIARLVVPPLRLHDGVDWDVLLADGPERFDVADSIEAAQLGISRAHAEPYFARYVSRQPAPQRDELQQAWIEQNREELLAKGWMDEHGQPQVDTMIRDGLRSLSLVGVEIPEHVSLEGPEGFAALAGQFMRSLPSGAIDSIVQRDTLQDVVHERDPAAVQLSLGRVSAHQAEEFLHSERDIDHVQCFIAHSDTIDFFHLDHDQQKILRAKEDHPIRIHGLLDRCFTPLPPEGVGRLLRRLIARRESSSGS